MSTPQDDPAAVSRTLLAAAGIPVSEDEAAGFATAYPALRAQADSLYLPLWTDAAGTDLAPAFGFAAAFEPDPAPGPVTPDAAAEGSR